MALISTYWGLVRPLRHHFRTGSHCCDRVKRAPTNLTDPPNEEEHAHKSIYVAALMPISRSARPSIGDPFMETTGIDSMHRVQLSHPLLGNAGNPVARGKSGHYNSGVTFMTLMLS